jgi:hypothetical protein
MRSGRRPVPEEARTLPATQATEPLTHSTAKPDRSATQTTEPSYARHVETTSPQATQTTDAVFS